MYVCVCMYTTIAFSENCAQLNVCICYGWSIISAPYNR